jgi:hypothetical protein
MQRHLLVFLLIVLPVPLARAANPLPDEPIDETLAKELTHRVEEENDAAAALLGDSVGKSELDKLEQVKKSNSAWLAETIEKRGWPGKSLVGLKGEMNAWLLAMHSDHDRKLQNRCIELLKEAVPKGKANGLHLAFLTDQVLVAEGKKQLYGTILLRKGGDLVPSPIEDEANVDKRRKEIGLPSVAHAIEQMRKFREKNGPKKT